jgi:Mn-containing catalase
MKDFLSFLIARDTMHQNQWLAVLEDLGEQVHPIPNSFPQTQEAGEFAYAFVSTRREPVADPGEPWTTGPAPDGKGTFRFQPAEPVGGIPELAPAPDQAHAQLEELPVGE